MKHPLAILSTITLISTTFLVGLVVYWLFVPDNVVTVNNPQALVVDKIVYKAGDRITYTLCYCKTRRIVGKVDRALVDGFRTIYEPIYSDLPTGCHTVKINELVIPSFTPTGTYHLDMTAEYKVNILKTYMINFRSVDFKVIQ